MHEALGLIDPAFGSELFQRLFLETGAYFDAVGGAPLLEGLSAPTGEGQTRNGDEHHGEEEHGDAEKAEKAVGRALGRFGRHISWSI